MTRSRKLHWPPILREPIDPAGNVFEQTQARMDALFKLFGEDRRDGEGLARIAWQVLERCVPGFAFAERKTRGRPRGRLYGDGPSPLEVFRAVVRRRQAKPDLTVMAACRELAAEKKWKRQEAAALRNRYNEFVRAQGLSETERRDAGAAALLTYLFVDLVPGETFMGGVLKYSPKKGVFSNTPMPPNPSTTTSVDGATHHGTSGDSKRNVVRAVDRTLLRAEPSKPRVRISRNQAQKAARRKGRPAHVDPER